MPRPNNETRNHLQSTVKNINSITLMTTYLSTLFGLAYSVVHKTWDLLSIRHLIYGVYMRYTNHIADKTFQHIKSLLEQSRMRNKPLQKELHYSHLDTLRGDSTLDAVFSKHNFLKFKLYKLFFIC